MRESGLIAQCTKLMESSTGFSDIRLMSENLPIGDIVVGTQNADGEFAEHVIISANRWRIWLQASVTGGMSNNHIDLMGPHTIIITSFIWLRVIYTSIKVDSTTWTDSLSIRRYFQFNISRGFP